MAIEAFQACGMSVQYCTALETCMRTQQAK